MHQQANTGLSQSDCIINSITVEENGIFVNMHEFLDVPLLLEGRTPGLDTIARNLDSAATWPNLLTDSEPEFPQRNKPPELRWRAFPQLVRSILQPGPRSAGSLASNALLPQPSPQSRRWWESSELDQDGSFESQLVCQ